VDTLALKIYYDHQVFSLHDAGGAPRYFFELIKHLQSYDLLQIEVALRFTSSVYPFGELANEHTKVLASRSNMRPGGYRYLLNELVGLPADLLRGKVDIYHPTLYRANRMVKRRHMVVTHHDCTHERYPELFKNARLVIKNKQRLYSAADAILCVSESSREDLIRYHEVDPSKTHVVHHGFTGFATDEPIEVDPLPVKRPYILFVGNRSTYKNFSTLLSAYRLSGLVSDYDLLAVGGGEFSDVEIARMTELKLMDRVQLIPRATDKELAEAYRRAAVFVYPSLYEGFGFPPLEAMSLGCPVVASNTSSIPEICGAGAVYFNPEDAAELSETLRSVLTDQPIRDTMREHGYAQVRLYDWQVTARKTLKVYKDVLDG
jgi:glycosyltransferase involved in cell wall biosynthesis